MGSNWDRAGVRVKRCVGCKRFFFLGGSMRLGTRKHMRSVVTGWVGNLGTGKIK